MTMKGMAVVNGAVAGAGTCEERKPTINSELWHACAGPLVMLPPAGSLVVYFPQGHSEQVAASMQKDIDGHIPNYPNLPSKLICLLHNVTLHADAETDEVYAQMTLQPVNSYDEKALLASDLALRSNKPQTEFFCKTLTASDTSTHGGFSVPRRAAEKIFPPLDFSMQPPAQELQARDLHDSVWTFRHIYRGQPKRYLLTTGWSLFVSGKRLFAGDSVLFIRDEKQQLLLGIRRANRQPTNLSSSVLSSDSMHIGILAAAAHAAANSSPFTVFYNPRASPSEFVVPLAKYQKAVYTNQISLGMRFRMMFETEESGTRRYMGTITGISDLDPLRWKNSQWRSLQVGWDESAAGERRNRVSIWEIEPVAAPFFICPPPFFRSKRPRQPGMPDDEASEMENLFKRAMPWLGEEICIKDAQSQSSIMPGLSLVQWMNMQQNPSLANPTMQPDYSRPVIQSLSANDISRQLGLQAQFLQQNNVQFNAPQPVVPVPPMNQLNSLTRPQPQIQQQQNNLQNSQQLLLQQQQQQIQLQHQQRQQIQQQQNIMSAQFSSQTNQQLQLSDHQLQLQLLQKLQQQHAISQQCASSAPMATVSLPQSSTHQLQQLPQQILLPELPATGNSLLAAVDVPSNDFAALQQQVLNKPQPKSETCVKPSVPISSKMQQRQGVVGPGLGPQAYMNNVAQMDYLDTSSSATSVCLSQTDGSLQHGLPSMFRDATQDCDVSGDARNNVLFGVNIEGPLGMPDSLLANNISDNVVANYRTSKDAQQELSSSMVSQSFGVADVAFDSAIDDGNFLNKNSWAPAAPQFQRMRTYTKVYKRGAVGRSIDISRYSGYDELKQDLARMFSIEGQLEDRQRIGWKLVYVDHESDVLLVGDDPWEEFVSCVRYVRILSPQEVQQMSLDGDLGNSILPNQTCSSSDGGNAWRGQCDQPGNPSAASYDHLE